LDEDLRLGLADRGHDSFGAAASRNYYGEVITFLSQLKEKELPETGNS
jgi:hypothetical protein